MRKKLRYQSTGTHYFVISFILVPRVMLRPWKNPNNLVSRISLLLSRSKGREEKRPW